MRASVPDPARPAPGFLESTGGALVVGRVILFRGLGEAFLAAWDSWRGVADESLALIPAHDLSRFEEYVGFEGCFRVAVGAPVATALADEGPSAPFDAGAIARAASDASTHLGETTIDALASLLPPREAAALKVQRTRPLLVPFGPIASVHLARGTLAPPLSTPPRGLSRLRGTDMRHRPHDAAIHGTIVASACDWDVAEPPLDREPARDSYHLVARYG